MNITSESCYKTARGVDIKAHHLQLTKHNGQLHLDRVEVGKLCLGAVPDGVHSKRVGPLQSQTHPFRSLHRGCTRATHGLHKGCTWVAQGLQVVKYSMHETKCPSKASVHGQVDCMYQYRYNQSHEQMQGSCQTSTTVARKLFEDRC